MSLKLASSNLNKLFLMIMFLLAATNCLADRVVKNTSTTFGRIKSFDSQSVIIAPGCAGEATQKINWADIEQFGGIEFDDTCNANWHASTSGSTAAGTGPTANWFAVSFNNNTFLWAEEINLGSDGFLRLKTAKTNVQLYGRISEVKRISRNFVYTNTINAVEYKWPESYSRSFR